MQRFGVRFRGSHAVEFEWTTLFALLSCAGPSPMTRTCCLKSKCPRSVRTFRGHCAAVMDNASIHHVAQLQQLFVDVGVLLVFQPPYSPDFNVAELCFAFVRRYLEDTRMIFTLKTLPCQYFFAALRHAINSITADLCSSWASHCGYDD